MAQTGLFEKVKEKLFEKDVDRGLETRRYRKTDKEYKARTDKLNLTFETNRKCVKLLDQV